MTTEAARRSRGFGQGPPFSSDDLAAACEGLWTTLAVPVGTVLFEEGDAANALYLVDDGEIGLRISTDDIDTDAVLGFARSGDLIGDLGVVSGAPRAATATAVAPSQLRRLDITTIARLENDDPRRAATFYRLLAKSVAARLHQTDAALSRSLSEAADDQVVNAIMVAATNAQALFEPWDEQRVDALLLDLARTVADHADELGEATVSETGLGVSADKAQKIRFASLGVLGSLLERSGSGVIDDDSGRRVTSLASPVGVIFAVTPITEPVSTYINKTLIALKGRNAIVVSPHSGSGRTATAVHELALVILRAHGAPEGLVQLAAERASRQRTARYLSHPSVGMILATGGDSLVRAAYRSGRPALGVGPGNAPVWIAPDADLERAARCVIESKTFDNGLICGAEQHLLVDRSVRTEFVATLQALGTRVLTNEEQPEALRLAFTRQGRFRIKLVGQSAQTIAAAMGLDIDHSVRMLAFWDDPSDPSAAGSAERLAPIVTLYEVDGEQEAVDLAVRLLHREGIGHTAIVHSEDEDRILRFAQAVPVSRVLVNVPASHGCGGALTGLVPSMTLGCGTFGGCSTTDNVGLTNVLNVKRIARPYLGNLISVKRLAK